jgi:hypothetical protein
LHRESNVIFGYERQSLVGLYCGASMPEAQKQMIAGLLANTNTKLYTMDLARGEFSLVASPISFAPIDYRKDTAK